MPRVKSPIRPVQKSIHLPEDLVARVDLKLYSALENRVPFGAWSELIQALLNRWLDEVDRPAGK